MAKATRNEVQGREDESCEIIELAIDELELLTRAFDVISQACESGQVAPLRDVPETLLN